MREVKMSDGTMRKVVPLTRKQIRKLAHLGVGCAGFTVDRDNFDEAFDGVLATQFDDAVLADLPMPDVRELFLGIIAETYGDPGEEKNS